MYPGLDQNHNLLTQQCLAQQPHYKRCHKPWYMSLGPWILLFVPCTAVSNLHLVTSHRQSQVPVLRCFAVTATFLHPLSAWARRQRQAHDLEPMCEDQGIVQDTASEPGIDARFATSKAFSSTRGQTEQMPHWVRSSSLCGAAVSSDGNILVSSPASGCCHQNASCD